MAPHDLTYSQIYALALAVAAVIANPDTPRLLRRELRSFIKRLRRELPKDARRVIEAAEAVATIKTTRYLRRGPDES